MAYLALLSLSLLLFSFPIINTTLTQAQCLPDQHHALIELKQGFNNTTQLHSWNASTDCCKWDGITCDEKTGMVTTVDLYYKYISGEINPALFNLSSLRYLNLAYNNFINISLPQTGFERLANLTHLELSYSGFTGQVPVGISTLTNLITLDLSTDVFHTTTLYLHGTGLKTLLSNLTKLHVLRLDRVDISLDGSEWGSAVFQVGPTLQELSMEACGLRGNFPDEIFLLTNLTRLTLPGNSMMSGQLPSSIGNMQKLKELDFHNCSFYGDIPPSIKNLTRLVYLDLGSNTLTGTIPMSLFSHPSLGALLLSNNQLSGYLPEFSNGSSILEFINLDYNNLEGQLPISIFKSPQLMQLDLESNSFNGTLNLDIIKHNKYLEYLYLSNNKLSIIESKNHNESFYASFPQISVIWIASCNITKFPSFLRYQTNIGSLDLSNNKIEVIPNWLGHFRFMQILDIHSNRISGPVPLLPRVIEFADFSSNYFFSLPPYFVSMLEYLSLSKNSLMGEIPNSICNSTLLVLDLSHNNLTGTMPHCLLENVKMKVLNLGSNKLSGPLPSNISEGCKFRTIDLGGNRINGCLPQSLMNCNALEVLDLRNNEMVDRFPFWLGNLENLRVLVLRSNQLYGTISNMEAKAKTNNSFFPTLKVLDISSNRFKGIIPKINLKAMVTNSNSSTFSPRHHLIGDSDNYYQNSIIVIWKGQEMEMTSSLSIFSSLDLSQNGFSGEVPKEIGQLKLLDVLNLSHNALIGSIPSEFANLNQLQSLDLSFNRISGHIPQELTSLTFLSALNLSYNNMVGEIPQARQFSTFSNASYLGNPELCGSPLTMQCATNASNQGFNTSTLPSKYFPNIIGLSISIGIGLGVGFASVIWAMISWENGRKRFNFIIDRFYFQHFH